MVEYSLARSSLRNAGVAIALWASLAALATRLVHVPPFLLVGATLLIGCLPALPYARLWFARPWLLLGGVCGLFGYHFLLFVAFRLAPPVQANLVNYLWPVLIMLFGSAILPSCRVRGRHVLGACLAFLGAALVLLRGGAVEFSEQHFLGYLCAFGAACVWAIYSVFTKTVVAFSRSLVGGFCAGAGILALLAHVLLEPTVTLHRADWLLLAIIGAGPLGLAFYAWDSALKNGDPRAIAALSYLTPVLSTILLAWSRGETLDGVVYVSLALVVSGAGLSR